MNAIPQKESEKAEFKSSFDSECIETLAAFANSRGGSVYVGIGDEILNMHTQTFNSSWDYYIDTYHQVTDISEEKANHLISLYNKSREIPIENDVPEFLAKMELIREGKLTHAAFLLLMKRESAVSTIELGHFQDEITIKDGITISADLITEVEDVLSFIRKHINKAYIITGNPAREERWDYPLDALREIVMNMIVHRDYAHYGDSSVKIYNEKNIRININTLKGKGLIERVGPDKGGYWKILI
ncbi:MAG: putative DNA binding domain-containing protein [Bacteroidales bacterium]|jgi:ATP-dependent DNA helicase RecG|nr:putative DNA binding domain-containing protein [Bacteroidales bacterium]